MRGLGTSGSMGERWRVLTASATRLPDLMRGSTAAAPSTAAVTWPAVTSFTAWPPPLYGMCSRLMPRFCENNSPTRCCNEP